MAGKIALVTGAAAGIGRAIALRLGEEGASQIIVDIDDKGLRETERMLKTAGHPVMAIMADVTEEAPVKALLFAKALAAHGRIDILVNDVGGGSSGHIWEATVEDWDFMHRLNLRSTFLCTREAAARTCASAAPAASSTCRRAHAREHAVDGLLHRQLGLFRGQGCDPRLTRGVALELAEYNVFVNAVAPGPIEEDRAHGAGLAQDRGARIRPDPRHAAAPHRRAGRDRQRRAIPCLRRGQLHHRHHARRRRRTLVIMKAAYIEKFGGPEVLTYGDLPDPKAGPGQIVVDVAAASINAADWKVCAGEYGGAAKFPLCIGRDFSGTVSAVGADVQDLNVGDEVFGVLEGGRDGTYAEKLAIGAAIVAKKPAGLSHVDAAAVALTGLTALCAIEDSLKLKAGETILIQGGAGGVASFAIQLAKHLGAKVITTASAANAAWLREIGADQVIDYNTTDFTKAVSNCDAAFDTVGGDVAMRTFAVLKPGGRATFIGSGAQAPEPTAAMYRRCAPRFRAPAGISSASLELHKARCDPSAAGHTIPARESGGRAEGERGASPQGQTGAQGAVRDK